MAAWIAGAILGSSLFGGLAQASAGKKAAKAQQQAATAANNETRRQFDIATQLNAPFQQSGVNALNLRNASIGLPQVSNPAAGGTGGFAGGGQSTVGQRYLEANPDVRQYFMANPDALAQFGGNMDAAAEYHYNTFGRFEGRPLPEATTSAADAAASTPEAIAAGQQSAYDTFLGSGQARSMLETTNNDFQQMVGAFGAGGTSLSGSAIGALNDRNRRNTNTAYNQWDNALAGISNTGAQVSQNQGQQGMQMAQTIGNNNMNAAGARASSYMNTADAINGGLQNATNALAYGYGNGWFGGSRGAAAQNTTAYRGNVPGYRPTHIGG